MNDPFWLPPALEMALNERALREFAAMSEAQKQAAAAPYGAEFEPTEPLIARRRGVL